jgi:hypothetical protein
MSGDNPCSRATTPRSRPCFVKHGDKSSEELCVDLPHRNQKI